MTSVSYPLRLFILLLFSASLTDSHRFTDLQEHPQLRTTECILAISTITLSTLAAFLHWESNTNKRLKTKYWGRHLEITMKRLNSLTYHIKRNIVVYSRQPIPLGEWNLGCHSRMDIYEGVPKSFRTESITKYMLTTINTRWEATRRLMAAKLTRLTQNSDESCTICSSHSRRSVRKLLDTLSYTSDGGDKKYKQNLVRKPLLGTRP
jgi:hypothetical protein